MAIKYVYVAGPMKADPLAAPRQAIATAEILLEAGLVPYLPQIQVLWQMISPRGYEDWMKLNFNWILLCDAVLRLPGNSPGADREVQFASDRNIPVFWELEELLWHASQQASEAHG